jgi:hypothetical protein
MSSVTFTKTPPKGRFWKVEVDGRKFETEEELIDSVRTNSRGNVFFSKTKFKDAKGSRQHYPSRQRNFSDGYFQYTFWFARMQDAAMFKLLSA